MTLEQIITAVVEPTPVTRPDIKEAMRAQGVSGREADRLIREAENAGLIHRWYFGSNVSLSYATVPQPPEGAP